MKPARRCFAGGNTCAGFVNYFQEILPPHKIRRLFSLKGGPGVGKSFFLKKLAQALEERGLAVEYLYCSGDPDSLDAVSCPSLGVVALDGTAPHVVDPLLPGAVDGIINLGTYLDEDALVPHRDEIQELSREKKRCYQRAYHYLNAAQPLYDDAAETMAAVTEPRSLERLLKPWLAEIEAQAEGSSPGWERRYFAEAITPQGKIQHLSTLSQPRLWRISSPWGGDVHQLLNRLCETALRQGLDVESLMDPCLPGQRRHLILPAMGLLITTEEDLRILPQPAERNLDLRVAQPNGELFSQQTLRALAFDRLTFDHLTAQAVESLALAKETHLHMEKYYAKHMDFGSAQQAYDHAWATIEKMDQAQKA